MVKCGADVRKFELWRNIAHVKDARGSVKVRTPASWIGHEYGLYSANFQIFVFSPHFTRSKTADPHYTPCP